MKGLKRFYTFLILFFLYAPILLLMVFSFNTSKSHSHWAGFTLKWYLELFSNQEIMTALYYTILIAVISAIFSTIFGTLAALSLSGLSPFPKQILLNINYLPVLNPDIVTAVSLMALYQLLHLEAGLFTIILAHISFCVPYVILSILPKIKQMDRNLPEAAMDLGARPSYALRKIVIPEIMPGIVTGALIAFTMSVDDFVISFFTAGNGVSNLSMEIYAMSRRGIHPTINALSTLMFIFLVVLLLIINKRSERSLP